MAVGTYYDLHQTQRPFAEERAGTGWTTRVLPSPANVDFAALRGVSCTSTSWCMAVGGEESSAGGFAVAYTWNGTAWSRLPRPSSAGYSTLDGVSCTSPTQCMAVGSAGPGPNFIPYSVLVEQWNGSTWSPMTAPTPAGSDSSTLTSVSCTSPGWCAAVGGATTSGNNSTLSETWNGTSWTIRPSPTPAGMTSGGVDSVSCTSPTACIAIGNYETSTNGTSWTNLAERWNGTSWAVQPIPTPPGTGGASLYSVACSGAASCVAVGQRFPTTSTSSALAEAWNGSSWSQIAAPAGSGALYGVACTGAAACTAVGYLGKSLAAAWNGTRWSTQTTPIPGGYPTSSLFGVSCGSSTFCQAVGFGTANGAPLVLAWHGTTWSTVPAPKPTGSPGIAAGTGFAGISCVSASACAAVGYAVTKPGPNTKATLAETWNGHTWTITATPGLGAGVSGLLLGVSCSAANACTAVGVHYPGNNLGAAGQLIERWNGATWSRQAAPTVPGAVYSSLSGVACPTVCWCVAVGAYSTTSSQMTLVDVWNGRSWKVQAAPPEAGYLDAVSCLSAGSCTAVGLAAGASLAERWDGTSWAIQPTPNPSGANPVGLGGVTCPTATSCVAVGYASSTTLTAPLAEAWDGTSWMIGPTPGPTTLPSAELDAVACPAAGRCFAVGGSNTLNGAFATLIEKDF